MMMVLPLKKKTIGTYATEKPSYQEIKKSFMSTSRAAKARRDYAKSKSVNAARSGKVHLENFRNSPNAVKAHQAAIGEQKKERARKALIAKIKANAQERSAKSKATATKIGSYTRKSW